MALQSRAEATRQKILDAAVDIFIERGFGETGLSEVLERAEVSKGAFYYHFDSKEAVAAAIIRQTTTRITDAFTAALESASPPFENVISATFAVADMMHSDRVTRLGHELTQGLSQVSRAGAESFQARTATFVSAVRGALAATEVRHDVDIEEAAEAIWVGVLGCHLLSHAIGGDLIARLSQAWRVLLRSIMPAHALPYFHEFVARTATAYARAV